MPKQAAGGPRQAVLSVRLPQRLRLGVELVSRLNREPMADVLVRAVETALKDASGQLCVLVPGESGPENALARVWDERESVRLVKLALLYPSLLNGKERAVWELVRDQDIYWTGGTAAKREVGALREQRLHMDWAKFASLL